MEARCLGMEPEPQEGFRLELRIRCDQCKVAAEATAVDDVTQYWHYRLLDCRSPPDPDRHAVVYKWQFQRWRQLYERSINYIFSNPIYPHTICASVFMSLSFPGTKKGKSRTRCNLTEDRTQILK